MKSSHTLLRSAGIAAGITAASGVLFSAGAVLATAMAYRAIRESRRFRLRDRVVLITGGSRGLGLAMARKFLQRGSRVAILARDAAELERARGMVGNEARVITVVCDVKDRDQVERAVSQIRERLGEIDVLVNNAGTITVGPMDTMKLDEYQEALDIYFWALLYTTLAVLPSMRARKSGRIVNISSIGGKISIPHLLPYSVGKFALSGFSEGLGAEVESDNIRVTTVYPGLMRTGSPRNAEFKGNNRAEYAWFLLSDATPGLSINADRAARQIVKACEYGKRELIVSLPAKIAIKVHNLFPSFTLPVLASVNRLLPSSTHETVTKKKGSESKTALTQSWLTALDQHAAVKNNQLA